MAVSTVAVNVDLTCVDIPSFCGKGIIEIGGACDDGNTFSFASCISTCQIETFRTIGGNVHDLGAVELLLLARQNL
jgi:cysteine-rich repeat protein